MILDCCSHNWYVYDHNFVRTGSEIKRYALIATTSIMSCYCTVTVLILFDKNSVTDKITRFFTVKSFLFSLLLISLENFLNFPVNYKFLDFVAGQKFPVKGLEMSLQANVHFYDQDALPLLVKTDNFCTGANSYIDVSSIYTSVIVPIKNRLCKDGSYPEVYMQPFSKLSSRGILVM